MASGLMDKFILGMKAGEWNFAADKEEHTIRFNLSHDGCDTIAIQCFFDEDSKLIALSIPYPGQVPIEKSKELMLFVAQKNYEIMSGGLVVLPCNTDFRFRNSIVAEGLEITPGFVNTFIRISTLAAFDVFKEIKETFGDSGKASDK